MKKSLRAQLRALVARHPEWTNKQYADHLMMNIDSLRGALSALKLSNRPGKPRKEPKKKKKQIELEPPSQLPKPQPRVNQVASRAGSSRFGYTKLL